MLSNGQYAPLSIRPRPRRHRPPQSYLNGGLFSYSPLHGPVSGITMLSTSMVSRNLGTVDRNDWMDCLQIPESDLLPDGLHLRHNRPHHPDNSGAQTRRDRRLVGSGTGLDNDRLPVNHRTNRTDSRHDIPDAGGHCRPAEPGAATPISDAQEKFRKRTERFSRTNRP